MGAYPLLVSLLDIGNGVLCAYAWMNMGRAVEGEAFRQHEGQNASHAPSVMSQEVHRLGPPFTVVDQVSQRCQHVRSTESSSDLRILNPIPCTYDPCQALCTTQKAKERLGGWPPWGSGTARQGFVEQQLESDHHHRDPASSKSCTDTKDGIDLEA